MSELGIVGSSESVLSNDSNCACGNKHALTPVGEIYLNM